MKFYLFIVTLFLAAMAVFTYQPPVQRPPPGSWKPFPTFPGQGPFNPRIKFPY
ncbi:Abaecin [Ooceraea biroi]|uniref:Abaecin n=1 Tax=Ooceraea biroi TaxID=2015173 RepID=A0A026VWS0_OOCBI|nr:Abaecin [Ooceraea biroi]